MSNVNFYIGQWLAILTVLVASGRGFYDAYLLPIERVESGGEQRLAHLRDKLKAMGKSPDKALRLQVVDELARLYLASGQYGQAEPFVLEILRDAQTSGDTMRHARQLTATGDFYADWRNNSRAEYCYLQTVPMYTRAQKWSELACSYLDLARCAQAKAEMKQGDLTAAQRYFGDALRVVKNHPISVPAQSTLRNTYLLMLIAEGDLKELPPSI